MRHPIKYFDIRDSRRNGLPESRQLKWNSLGAKRRGVERRACIGEFGLTRVLLSVILICRRFRGQFTGAGGEVALSNNRSIIFLARR